MFGTFFNSAGLMPHGFCLLWQPELLALHIVGDGATGLAYLSVSLAIVSFLRRKPYFEYRWVACLFAGFIVLCGLSHFASVIMLWQPYYVLDGLLKFATAAVSIVTAVVLWPLIPEMLRIQSPHLLEAA